MLLFLDHLEWLQEKQILIEILKVVTGYVSKYCEHPQRHCWVGDRSTKWSESRGSTSFWGLRLGNMGMCSACAAYAYLWFIYAYALEQQRSWGNVIGDSWPLLHLKLHSCLVRRQPKLTWTQRADPLHFFNVKCECRTTNVNPWFMVGTRWNSSFFSVTLNTVVESRLPHCIFVRTPQTLGWNTIFRIFQVNV